MSTRLLVACELAPVVGRPIAVCYEVTSDGRLASGGACDASTADGQVAGLTFDSVASAFNGAGHFADINANQLSNASSSRAPTPAALGTAHPGSRPAPAGSA